MPIPLLGWAAIGGGLFLLARKPQHTPTATLPADIRRETPTGIWREIPTGAAGLLAATMTGADMVRQSFEDLLGGRMAQQREEISRDPAPNGANVGAALDAYVRYTLPGGKLVSDIADDAGGDPNKDGSISLGEVADATAERLRKEAERQANSGSSDLNPSNWSVPKFGR